MIKEMELVVYTDGKGAEITLTPKQIEVVTKVLGIEIKDDKVIAFDDVSLEHILNCNKQE